VECPEAVLLGAVLLVQRRMARGIEQRADDADHPRGVEDVNRRRCVLGSDADGGVLP
jgi:hypothetical protein